MNPVCLLRGHAWAEVTRSPSKSPPMPVLWLDDEIHEGRLLARVGQECARCHKRRLLEEREPAYVPWVRGGPLN